MSDLAATNCGCNDGGSCSTLLWLILLLSCCSGSNGIGLQNNGGNDSCPWIILLLLCCGGGCNGNGFF